MKYSNNALLVGSIIGIPIRLHISLLIAIVLVSLGYNLGIISVLILAIGIFGSVLLHELGHSIVAQAKGSYIHEIVLYPIGGAAKISNMSKRPMDEILIALAGPAVSLLLWILLSSIKWELTLFLGYVNLMLFLFNMLPVFPMDGGRVLRAGLLFKYGRPEATRLAAKTGKYFCGLFVLIGLFGMPFRLLGLIGPLQPSLFLAFIGGYIYFAGQNEYRMVLAEQQAENFRSRSDPTIEVEVSPPPYANSNGVPSVLDKIRGLFRR